MSSVWLSLAKACCRKAPVGLGCAFFLIIPWGPWAATAQVNEGRIPKGDRGTATGLPSAASEPYVTFYQNRPLKIAGPILQVYPLQVFRGRIRLGVEYPLRQIPGLSLVGGLRGDVVRQSLILDVDEESPNNVTAELNRESRRSIRHQGVEGWLGARVVIINDIDVRVWLEGQTRYRRAAYRARQLEFLPVNPGSTLNGELRELSWVARKASIDQWGMGGGVGIGFVVSRDLGLMTEAAIGVELNRARLNTDPTIHPLFMRLTHQWDHPLYHGLLPYIRFGLAMSLGSM